MQIGPLRSAPLVPADSRPSGGRAGISCPPFRVRHCGAVIRRVSAAAGHYCAGRPKRHSGGPALALSVSGRFHAGQRLRVLLVGGLLPAGTLADHGRGHAAGARAASAGLQQFLVLFRGPRESRLQLLPRGRLPEEEPLGAASGGTTQDRLPRHAPCLWRLRCPRWISPRACPSGTG